MGCRCTSPLALQAQEGERVSLGPVGCWCRQHRRTAGSLDREFRASSARRELRGQEGRGDWGVRVLWEAVSKRVLEVLRGYPREQGLLDDGVTTPLGGELRECSEVGNRQSQM